MTTRTALSPDPFTAADGSRLAYLKEVRSEDVALLYPEAPALQPGQRVFALHLADGTPVVLAESRASALQDAREFRLEMVSVH
jgi:hypothetical protein